MSDPLHHDDEEDLEEDGAPPLPIKGALLRIFAVLSAVTVLLAGAGWAWGGLDTVKGVLLGCVLVAFNLAGTAHFVRAVIAEQRFKARLVASFTLKLAVTLGVLYVALRHYNFDAIGILIGLSSMLLVSLILIAFKPAK
jgi:hypothetical protein